MTARRVEKTFPNDCFPKFALATLVVIVLARATVTVAAALVSSRRPEETS